MMLSNFSLLRPLRGRPIHLMLGPGAPGPGMAPMTLRRNAVTQANSIRVWQHRTAAPTHLLPPPAVANVYQAPVGVRSARPLIRGPHAKLGLVEAKHDAPVEGIGDTVAPHRCSRKSPRAEEEGT